MEQTTEFVRSNFGVISTVFYFVLFVAVMYWVLTSLYPSSDPSYVKFLTGEADARKPITLDTWKVPNIYTGGDFTFSFWMYIEDWNYRVSANKFVFAISPALLTNTSVSPLVGVLTPLKNGLMVRASTVGNKTVPAPGDPATVSGGVNAPDITVESNLQNLLNQQTSMSMFETTVEERCDVKEIALQRWTNVTIVSSGRVLDVYVDGKLTRSCVLDNVLNVPRGQLKLRLGEHGGFGGRYSAIQMWNQQLTPDLVYGIYQMGPTQTQHGIFADLAKFLNINITFTGTGTALSQQPAQDCNNQTGTPSAGTVGSIPGVGAVYNQVGQIGQELTSAIATF